MGGIVSLNALAPAITYNGPRGGAQEKCSNSNVSDSKTTCGSYENGDIVVIPVDESEQAETAFDWYVRHVHRPSNLVHIVHCLEVEPHPHFIRGHTYDSNTWHGQVEKARSKAENLVSKYEDKLKEYHMKGDVIAETGHPGHVVVEAANKCNAAMIVMGSRGYGMIRRTVLGSVSNYVVHHTSIPVTVVPKENHKFF